MSRDYVRKLFTRRSLLQASGGTLGGLWALSQATGLPIPILTQINQALAQGGAPLKPVGGKMFILISNQDGIRPNDFNMHKAAQPQFQNLNYNVDTQMLPVIHREGVQLMYPPGIGTLAKYGNRMAVLLGVDTLSNAHPQGDRNSTTNSAAGGNGTSIHTLVGAASGKIVPSYNFSGVAAFNAGAQQGGQSPQAIQATLQLPAGPAQAVLDRLASFRENFHQEIVKSLAAEDQEVIKRYWDSNDAFKRSQTAARDIVTQVAPANTFDGQLEMAYRLYKAGISNAFMLDGTGGQGFGFDTHGGNTPQIALARTMSNSISAFLDRVTTEGRLDEVNIVITTSFGRNPTFNGSGGDDHLPSNGHMTLIGPDFNPGAFGRTTNTQATARGVYGHAVNPKTGESTDNPSPGGDFRGMTPANVLKSVLLAVGVPQGAVDSAFPQGEVLPFIKKA